MAWFRRTLFHSIRLLGGFEIARRLTRKQLRILCYHGFSVSDEHELSPYVFMRPETFARRMRILQKRGLPVISLDDAVRKLKERAITNGETVITLDDGWASNLVVLPILKELSYPACIYVTTEHLSGASTEAFNVTVAHLVHRSRKESISLRNIHPELDGEYQIAKDPANATLGLVAAAARILPYTERQKVLAPLAASLGVDYHEFTRGGRFRLMSASELRTVSDLGVSVQLHTHTHSLPNDSFAAVADEIRRNRDAVAELTGSEPVHFCYPSGEHSPQHPEWLERLGIVSATTCDAGFNDSNTPPLLLKRYLDTEQASDIEFEAEIVGLRQILRQLRSGLKSLIP
jgi:peptidoglycan/xylan/chitin deacetylase (PgdA/CDA1 family)